MIFCNPVPIAFSCYLDKNVVKDAHGALFAAIRDLAKLGYSLNIKCNFAVLIVRNLAL